MIWLKWKKRLLLGIIMFYGFLALWGWLDWFPPNWQYIEQNTVLARYYSPSRHHPLGVFFQQDLLIAFVRSTCSAVEAGGIATLFFLLLGILMGVGSGIHSGSWHYFISSVMNIFNALPKFIVLLLYAGLFSVNLIHMLILYGAISAPKLGELLKARIQELKREDFIDASIVLGVPIHQIIGRHILWYHSRYLILSQIFYMFAMAIFMEASLSYLNLGIKQGYQSWGLMLNYATSVGGLTLFTWPWANDFNLPAFLPSTGLMVIVVTLLALSQVWSNADKKRRGWTIQ